VSPKSTILIRLSFSTEGQKTTIAGESEEQDGEKQRNDSDSDSSSDEEEKVKSKSPSSLQINKKFAADYVHRKQEEEYKKIKQQGGGRDDESGSESSSSSEDEDGELLTPALDVDIFKTINALRSKDTKIYDPTTKFFPKNSKQSSNQQDDSDSDDDSDEDKAQRKKKSKPKRYKDVVREQTLEKMKVDGADADSESSDDENAAASTNYETQNTSRLTYDAQQKELRRAFLDTAGDDGAASDDDSDDSDNLMVRKGSGSKTADDEDDEETRQQLMQEMEKFDESAARQSKGDRLVDPKGEVPDGDKFLMDYFKKQAWSLNDREDGSDSDADNEEIPLKPPRVNKADGGGDSDEDSIENLDRSDTFESEYNFRFEQAAGGGAGAGAPSGAELSVVGYARGQTMNTLRRKDESRRDKRLARQERKATERKAKEEQLKRLKNAKRQEMDAKLKQIKAVLGSVEDGGAPVDEAAIMKLMEGDFDPEKFEELMKESYGDDYYEQEDPEWKTDQDVREFVKSDEDGALLVGQMILTAAVWRREGLR
jgi:protein KRI1